MEDRSRGLLIVLFASLCLSTVPAVVKLGLRGGADPLQLLAPRMVLGTGLLWLWVLSTRPRRARIDQRGLGACALAGGLNAVSLVLFYLGLRRIDASISILVFSVYPAMLLSLLHLRGERVTRRDLLRLALALAGIVLVVDPRSSVDPVGVAFVVGCAAVYSVYMLVLHSRLGAYAASTVTLWVVTFFCLGVVTLRPLTAPSQALDRAGWAVVVWSGVVGTAVARLATVEGIRRLGGGQTALLMPVETVLSITWATLLLGERASLRQAAGAGLVFASVLLATILRRIPQRRE